MKRLALIIWLILPISIAGCATQASLTFHTVPPGAYITSKSSGTPHGISPITVYYNWDKNYVRNGCLQTQGVTATWVSGAFVSSGDIIPICGGPGAYTFSLSRPANALGLEKDMQFGMQVQQSMQNNYNDSQRNSIMLYDALFNK